MIKNAVIYARFSSNNQREESIDAQVRVCEEYCKKKGWKVLKVYSDHAITGTSDKRDEFQKMINESKKGLFDIVIVYKFDRFARNRFDSAIYKKKLRDIGIKVVSAMQDISDDPQGVIIESLFEGMDEYYSLNLSVDVKRGLKQNALNCVFNGGTPPLGYNIDESKHYVINEEEARTVRLVYELYAKGYGYASIAKEVNAKGYKSKSGGEFKKTSIYDILINEKYTGTFIFGKRVGKSNRKYKDDSEIIRIENGIPRIVSDELYQSVKKMMSKRTKPRVNSKYDYILTGYMVCDKCGSPFVGGNRYKAKGKWVHVYSCNKKINYHDCKSHNIKAEDIEDLVVSEINKLFNTKESIKDLAKQVFHSIQEDSKSSKSSTKTLKSNLTKLESNKEKLFDLYLDDLISKDEFSKRKDDLDSKIEEIQIQLKELALDVSHIDLDNIETYIYDFFKNDKLNDSKKRLIEAFVSKIVVDDATISITLAFDKIVQSSTIDKVGGAEGSRTPVQKQSHVLTSTV